MHTNNPFIIFLIIIALSAAVFFGTYLIMYVAFHSRAVAVRKVVPNSVLQIRELNVASMRTLRYALGIRHPPKILTWTFDTEGATLWGSHPKAGPVLRIEKNQTFGLIPIEVCSKGYYPGIGIRLIDATSGEESGIGWIVRDPDRTGNDPQLDRPEDTLTNPDLGLTSWENGQYNQGLYSLEWTIAPKHGLNRAKMARHTGINGTIL